MGINWQTIAELAAVGLSITSGFAWLAYKLIRLAWQDRLDVEGRLDDAAGCLLDHEGRIKRLEACRDKWESGHKLDRGIRENRARADGHEARLTAHSKRIDRIEQQQAAGGAI